MGTPWYATMKIVEQDFEYIYLHLKPTEKAAWQNSTILITGCAGFLGFYLLSFLTNYGEKLGIKKIIGLDSFLLGRPHWLDKLCLHEKLLSVYPFNIATNDISTIPGSKEANFVFHMASVASPTYYRQYPLETLDANVLGLRRLLDFYRDKVLRGFVFFSSSEIYGSPDAANIPTREDYNGNVSPIGPRACYDEAKRFGETLCYVFGTKYHMPITVVRPFNDYGPGMQVTDKRVPADFAAAIMKNQDITVFSDGTPTRTFCYIADATLGYLKAALYGKYDFFNIGTSQPELSISQFAELCQKAGQEITGYQGKILYQTAPEKDYLCNNPLRRCPDTHKAEILLDFCSHIQPQEGFRRYLQFLKEEHEQ